MCKLEDVRVKMISTFGVDIGGKLKSEKWGN